MSIWKEQEINGGPKGGGSVSLGLKLCLNVLENSPENILIKY